MSDSALLIATILTPLVGAVLTWLASVSGRSAARAVALLTSLLTLVMAAILVANFTGGAEDFAGTSYPWLPLNFKLDIRFSVALDGISLWFFALSALLTVTSILVSWEAI